MINTHMHPLTPTPPTHPPTHPSTHPPTHTNSLTWGTNRQGEVDGTEALQLGHNDGVGGPSLGKILQLG